jgi:tagatose 1,6-diphosphate aldolase
LLAVGTYRHLTQCSDPNGKFVILALDHRGNLITDLAKHSGSTVGYEEVVAFKTALLRHLLPAASAALIDPDYGLPALADGYIPGHVGLLAPLEVTDYNPPPSRRVTTFINGWNVSKVKQAGFSGAKLLLYYHPEAKNARAQTDIVDSVVEQCQLQQLPLFLEPICYSLDQEHALTNTERRQIVIETARHFTQRGVEILKLEFPLDVFAEPNESVWRDALNDLNAACSVPWALLSAGVAYETFLRQAQLACEAGASGVIVGRAIWAEAVSLQGDARERFLTTTAHQRMGQLAEVCRSAQPWTQRYPAPNLAEGWYRN